MNMHTYTYKCKSDMILDMILIQCVKL